MKFCPRCGSRNIVPWTKGGAITEELIDHCQDCNYSGFIPEVKESGIKEFRKKLNKKHLLKKS